MDVLLEKINKTVDGIIIEQKEVVIWMKKEKILF